MSAIFGKTIFLNLYTSGNSYFKPGFRYRREANTFFSFLFVIIILCDVQTDTFAKIWAKIIDVIFDLHSIAGLRTFIELPLLFSSKIWEATNDCL